MRGLYLLTPERDDSAALSRDVEAALCGGHVALLQYRAKAAEAALRREQLRALQPLCERFAVPLVVNDDVALAREAGAAGVHLGESDAGIGAARRVLGDAAIIGASCYDRIDLAEQAVAAGASYVAFGAFHPSATKPCARRASLELLRAPLPVPKVAIGGITADNARALIEAGADLVAVISDVFDAPDITAAVRRYATLFQDHP